MGLNRAIVALSALLLAGCANDAGFGPHRETGALDTNFSGTPTTTANIGRPTTGTPAAGLPGGPIGADLDERDRQRAYAAERQALEHGEPGEPTGWRSETPGRFGTIVPGVPYERGGTRCRDYSHSIYIDGKPQIARMTACRNPDGSWMPVG
jgi:surface antigen